jgi:hypothetical protein
MSIESIESMQAIYVPLLITDLCSPYTHPCSIVYESIQAIYTYPCSIVYESIQAIYTGNIYRQYIQAIYTHPCSIVYESIYTGNIYRQSIQAIYTHPRLRRGGSKKRVNRRTVHHYVNAGLQKEGGVEGGGSIADVTGVDHGLVHLVRVCSESVQ